jgi:outer membrane biosynthesis protein TonB
MSTGTGSSSWARHWPWQRLAVALGASLLAHYLIVGAWTSSGGGRSKPMMTQLKAQLEIPAAPLTVTSEASPDLSHEASRPGAAPSVPSQVTRTAPTSAFIPEAQSPASSGSAIPDSRFYSARELDRFPAPVTPLELRSGTGRAGSVRVRIGIDLAGRVVDLEVVDGDPSGALEIYAREHLQAIRFLPGLKDDRPVRSRILLELHYGP